MVAVNLAHDLGKRGIAAVVLHPGMVATAMTFDDERHEARPPEDAAAALIERIDRVEPPSPALSPPSGTRPSAPSSRGDIVGRERTRL